MFLGFLLDFLFLNLISHHNKLIKIVSIIILAILSIQSSSLMFSGFLISPLYLANLSHLDEVGIKPILFFLMFFITFIILYVIFQYFLSKKKIPKKYKWLTSSFLLILIVSFNSPIFSFFSNAYDFYYSDFLVKNSDESNEIISKEIEKKEIVYDSDISKYIPSTNDNNVIIIFAEGMSYDIISEETTPNISELISNSLNIENFYNHTAATFRGLRGQLTSSYQMTGGYYEDNSGIGQLSSKEIIEKYDGNKLISVADILKNHGYNTYFQASNTTQSQLSVMLKTLGFDRIFGYEDKKDAQKWSLKELSDSDSFDLLFENLNTIKQPFFYGMYTVGTHIGLDSPSKKFKDGNNPYKNKFYNFDYQLGRFIKNFNAAPISDNTILILTADHSSFPDPEFKKTFKTKSNYFVDRVPFIIYKKGIKPAIFNANGLNSLSIAPTILDICGIKKGVNKFLGISIFDKVQPSRLNRITAIGSEVFNTENNEIKILNDSELKDKVIKLQIYGG